MKADYYISLPPMDLFCFLTQQVASMNRGGKNNFVQRSA